MSNDNEFEYPPEWFAALQYNLAESWDEEEWNKLLEALGLRDGTDAAKEKE